MLRGRARCGPWKRRGTPSRRWQSTPRGSGQPSARTGPTQRPPPSLLPDASAGTRRWTCEPDTVVPAATSAPRGGGTPPPTAARTASGADIRTSTASADRADRNPDALSPRLRLARTQAVPSPAGRRTRRSPGTHDRLAQDRPALLETVSPDSAPRLG